MIRPKPYRDALDDTVPASRAGHILTRVINVLLLAIAAACSLDYLCFNLHIYTDLLAQVLHTTITTVGMPSWFLRALLANWLLLSCIAVRMAGHY